MGGNGDAGDLAITTGRLEVLDDAVISASTKGIGKGGSVDIDSTALMFLSGGEIKVNSDAENGGSAGNIRITSPQVKLGNNAKITAWTVGADGGSIEISVPDYLHLDQSAIETQVKAEQGNGGNITISPGFIVLEHGRINADAIKGNGGRIDIDTYGVYQFDREPLEQVITATSTEGGIDGEISLTSPDIDISGGLMVVPASFVDEGALQVSPCSIAEADKASRFTVSRCHSGMPTQGRDDLLPPEVTVE